VDRRASGGIGIGGATGHPPDFCQCSSLQVEWRKANLLHIDQVMGFAGRVAENI
jgi:hypothetical protein